MLAYKERVFADAIKLRFSRQQDYPGWSGWDLNQITVILKGKTEGDLSHEEEEKAMSPLRQSLP